eukprot:10328310-Alexandrium_andersonii.AAC.1
MIRIRNCSELTWRKAGDHIGTSSETHRAWQNSLDPDMMGTRSFFYYDCLDFMDVAAFDYNFQPEFGLEEYAKEMVK